MTRQTVDASGDTEKIEGKSTLFPSGNGFIMVDFTQVK